MSNHTLPQYSVLMSVYLKERPDFLKESIESILHQTVKTNDFVLVCDGPLTLELEQIISEYNIDNPMLFNIVRLPKNVGIGAAANIGLANCKNELIAKMDSDDIALPHRCAKQLRQFTTNHNLVILGGQLAEFVGDEKNVTSYRNVPTKYQDILQYARRRDPFNNQTVMYKKSAIQKVGGYQNLSRCEDYDLYVRCLQANYYCENLPEILVNYRLAEDTYQRRKSIENLRGFIQVRWKIHKSGFSSMIDFIIPTVVQMLIYIFPCSMQKKIYEKFLRK